MSDQLVGRRGNRIVKARFIRLGEDDGSFDREFWQSVGHEGRFAAAWGMIADVEAFRGKDASQSRLQRSVASFRRREG